MVRILTRLLATLALVLPLASCIFVLSVFPPTLSQVVARADLSGTIPAGAGSQYRVYVVTPTGGDFVILMNRNSSMDPAAVVMDSNLQLIQTYTAFQLNGWGITNGSTLMTDASGNVALRDHWFGASDLTTINHNPSGTLGGAILFDPGFCSPYWQKNDVNFQMTGGNTLTYTQYQWWGLPPDFTSSPIQINGAGGNYRVAAVYNVDDTPSAGKVVLVLSEQNNSSNVTLVAIPLADVVHASPLLPTVASPLLNNYPYKVLTNINSSSIGFAGDSLVAFSYDSHSLKRYSLTPPFNEIGSIPMGKSNDQLQYAYRMTGGYSVVYDEETRKLTKVANWW